MECGYIALVIQIYKDNTRARRRRTPSSYKGAVKKHLIFSRLYFYFLCKKEKFGKMADLRPPVALYF